jgi:hypothetical protein
MARSLSATPFSGQHRVMGGSTRCLPSKQLADREKASLRRVQQDHDLAPHMRRPRLLGLSAERRYCLESAGTEIQFPISRRGSFQPGRQEP